MAPRLRPHRQLPCAGAEQRSAHCALRALPRWGRGERLADGRPKTKANGVREDGLGATLDVCWLAS